MNAEGKPLNEEDLWGDPPGEGKTIATEDVCPKNPDCTAWGKGKCHAVGGGLCQQNKDL